MTDYSVFDIVGPRMVGPSSSHTAGAVKLGQIARALFDATPEKVVFSLHGSFGQVYKGHATDRALLAGIMKFKTSDPKIKDAFEIAKEKKIKFEFKLEDLGISYHPNTVKISLDKGKKHMTLIGSSIGGGNVIVKTIDDFDVDLAGIAGKRHSVIISHSDNIHTIAEIMNFLATNNVSVSNIQSTRIQKGQKVITFVSTDDRISMDLIYKMENIPNINFVRALNKVNI